ncbi:LysM peptidoglycan-binding domain-containing protein [Mesobacillus subterraneus]|uniref:LysM peptidoglycan-binding domain-containing protein n=1 Tax=Mesobacillus subterraneus TaxID=285983 RepID=A0A427TPY4_9BACI|nr:LysM peptidoglycan-binding domain-containing protein [Mesobacillus subterraneus]RSD26464.1 LysM peptidoglycan-binding domain-containing protein [Mesobacillus subterraneus]
MNKEKPIRDQAERLRKRVERKTDHAVEKKETLPPRSSLHRQKQKKTKVKVKYPVIRLMALFFILLPISFFSVISYLEGTKGPLKQTLERAGVELINVEKNSEKEEEDDAAPVFEEIEDAKKVEVVSAAPAPSSSGDKDTTENSAPEKEKKAEIETVQASSPPAEEAETAEETAAPEAEGEDKDEKIIYHTVKPSETLYRVSMMYFKSQDGIPIIKKANNIQGNEIQAGQVLKIPVKN